MTKREYLRSIGFQVGERGRFNDAMKIALASADIIFDEDNVNLKLDIIKKTKLDKQKQREVKIQVSNRHREPRTLSGFTREGVKVAFVNCNKCKEHMIFCGCVEGVHSPSIVTYSKDSLVFVPQV